MTEHITDRQLRALHVYFRNLAELLAEQDIDFRTLHVPITPTEALVKSNIWKPVQEAMYGTKSVKDLTTSQVSEVYDHLNRALIERFGINLPFPEQDMPPEAQGDGGRAAPR